MPEGLFDGWPLTEPPREDDTSSARQALLLAVMGATDYIESLEAKVRDLQKRLADFEGRC